MVNVFFVIHRDLFREGPGDNESTGKAYIVLHDLAAKPRVLDVGVVQTCRQLNLQRFRTEK